MAERMILVPYKPVVNFHVVGLTLPNKSLGEGILNVGTLNKRNIVWRDQYAFIKDMGFIRKMLL
jgi:hypothetical protein